MVMLPIRANSGLNLTRKDKGQAVYPLSEQTLKPILPTHEWTLDYCCGSHFCKSSTTTLGVKAEISFGLTMAVAIAMVL